MNKQILKIIILAFFLMLGYNSFSQYNIYPNTVDNNVQIFPNPTTKPYFYVKSSQIISKIEVIDLVGKTVVKRDFTSYYADKILIELPHNSKKGLFLVKITFDDNQVVIKKLIYK